jgi:hypothetical protein
MLTQSNKSVWGVEVNIYAFVITEIAVNNYFHAPEVLPLVKKPPVHDR